MGRGLRKEVLPTGSACQASVRRGGIPGPRWGHPVPCVEEVPSLSEARLPVPAHASSPWGRRPELFSEILSPALPTGLPGKRMAGGRLGQWPWVAESASLTLSPPPGANSLFPEGGVARTLRQD